MSRPRQTLTTDRYDRAVALVRPNRDALVSGLDIAPVWSADSDSLWFGISDGDSREYVSVDAATGRLAPAFDHDAVATLLSRTTGEIVDAKRLEVESLDLTGDIARVSAASCRWAVDVRRNELVAERLPAHPWELVSPDGRSALYVKDWNLWVRSLEDDSCRQLTRAGTEEEPYGVAPDPGQNRIAHRLLGTRARPTAVWSPDSRKVATQHLDQRGVSMSILTRSRPSEDAATAYEYYRYPLPGDEQLPSSQVVSIDLATGTEFAAPPMVVGLYAHVDRSELWWVDDRVVAYTQRDRFFTSIALRELDAITGAVRTVVEESGTSRRVQLNAYKYRGPIVAVLPELDTVLWYSERDGWGHLYRYRYSDGSFVGQVTSGSYRVSRIAHVGSGQVYLEVTGLSEDDPYRSALRRVDIATGAATDLVLDDLDHAVTMSPDGRHYVDRASRSDIAPRTILRHVESDETTVLHECSTEQLERLGWRPHLRVEVFAADGTTRLFGNLTLPFEMEEGRKYPLIDDIYPGPQINKGTPGWLAPQDFDADALASLGFGVLMLDGRGTPGRDRDFHQASLGNLGTAGFLDDHVAAIKQLAEMHDWIDTDRIAIKGASGGGYAAARAMLDHPKTFKVAVALCGDHDQRFYQAHWAEGYQGSSETDDWSQLSNPARAARLEGKLFLAHGELDDNVHVTQTLRLVDALIDANKDFELLIVPGVEHLFIGRFGYVTRRSWDFLVRNLLGVEPPLGYRIPEETFRRGIPT